MTQQLLMMNSYNLNRKKLSVKDGPSTVLEMVHRLIGTSGGIPKHENGVLGTPPEPLEEPLETPRDNEDICEGLTYA